MTTAHLKYLLLPALLGDLSLRCLTYERLEMLQHAETYYRDFIRRLNEYQVCDLPHLARGGSDKDENEEEGSSQGKLKRDPLVSSAIFRDSKINRYKESRRLEEALTGLKVLLAEQKEDPSKIDEDVERRFYLTLIRLWLGRVVDELASIELEKPMAKMHLASVAAGSSADASGSSNPGKPHSHHRNPFVAPKPKPKPPIIITRDAAQKAVFGIGYPAYPTMTVEEFISGKEADGSLAFQDSRVYGNSLYDWANDPEKKVAEEVSEEERKERLEEADDPVELARRRRMDDWKDEHRRGEGNRHNMG